MSRVGWSWSSGRHLRRLPAGQTVSWLHRDVPDGCPLAGQEECGRQVRVTAGAHRRDPLCRSWVVGWSGSLSNLFT